MKLCELLSDMLVGCYNFSTPNRDSSFWCKCHVRRSIVISMCCWWHMTSRIAANFGQALSVSIEQLLVVLVRVLGEGRWGDDHINFIGESVLFDCSERRWNKCIAQQVLGGLRTFAEDPSS